MPAVRDKTTTDLSPPRTRSRVSIPTRLWSPPSVVPSPDHTSTSSASTSAPHLVSPAARRRKGPDYIPRPPNAFILFRQTLFKQLKEGAIEHDQRLFSQIISTTWAELGAADKEVWYKQAADLKEAHTQKYPNYRFSPVVRMDKPRKRNVKRNGPKDKERCRRLGKLIAQGRDIHELEREAKRIDATMREDGGAGKGASELGIPVSENYSTSIFDLTLCDPCDTTDASTPQPSTPRLSGPHIGIPT
ncbi:high mobility group box domain-containing protein [Fomitopsis serialis]|uniref:high mobility group box domain-containing protein n=1 Tax=Fomitopsis serialis TaxID=139415 RepID=UPI002008C3A6|nr:high mobility group box domain-containing protein [Neoantrodia serialis]KAH9920272.1 high mobility group box domain-containing protein [Neoantrodia serialis]